MLNGPSIMPADIAGASNFLAALQLAADPKASQAVLDKIQAKIDESVAAQAAAEQAQRDLAAKEFALSGRLETAAKKELDAAQAEYEAKVRVAELEASAKEVDAELAKTQAAADAVLSKMAAAQEQLDSLTQQVAGLQRQAAAEDVAVQNLAQRRDALAQECESLEKRVEAAKAAINKILAG